MKKHGHSRLENRYALRGEVVCDSAVHVGTGSTSDVQATSDMPVARDGSGHPYIPGSSFRGALRSGLEALLRGLGDHVEVCDPLARDLSGEDSATDTGDDAELSCSARIHNLREAEREKVENSDRAALSEERSFKIAWNRSCEVCRLFGNTFLASRLWIADLQLASDPAEVPTTLRDGVGLDRDLRTAAKGILYNFEAVPAGACFGLRMEIENAQEHELGLLLTGLDLFGHGVLGLGGKRARGLGLASVSVGSLARWQAEDFFNGGEGKQLEARAFDALRAAARAHYVEAS